MKDDIKPSKKTASSADRIEAEVPPKQPEQEAPIEHLDEPIVIDEVTVDKKPGRFDRLLHFKHDIWDHWSKRQKIIASIATAVVLALIIGGVATLSHKPTIPNAQTVKTQLIKPKTVASPLSGVQVDPLLAKRPVSGIMIENSQDARPQSGLQDAGIVYEAIAEAGITRFLALFQDTSPQYIGPVRSLRPYYIDFAAPFQASIVHVGGSPDALSKVTSGGYRNLDQFYNGNYFTRVNSRYAPHNVYTSFNQLDALNQSKGYITSAYTSLPRKADKKLATPTASKIDLTVSSAAFNVHYDYEASTNSYLRSEGGAPHLDLVSSSDVAGVQLKPKVVIALVMSLSNGALDASGAYYSNYIDTGSGPMYVFQDGGVAQGTWSKAGTTDQFKFQDTTGRTIKFNAGQTWITIIQSGQLSYTP